MFRAIALGLLLCAFSAVASAETPRFGDDDGSVVDVLVVYTRRAMCEHAGLTYHPCPATPRIRSPIEEFIRLQFSVTNYALANTGINMRMNLAHLYMDPDYDEDKESYDPEEGMNSISRQLDHLNTRNDGYLDDAHVLRDRYCADLVTLVSSGFSASSGLAGGPFSVINHMSEGYAAPHEWGHSLKAGLRDDDPNKEGFNYGYGTDEYATVMAFGGAKYPIYSTPDRTWNGRVVGGEKEDNRRSILENLHKSANHHRSELCDIECEYGAASGGCGLTCDPAKCSTCHFPPDLCYDDPNFRYEGDADKNCEWARSDPYVCQMTDLVDHRKVEERCPVSCGACPSSPAPAPPLEDPEVCEDDPNFRKDGDEAKGCEWVASNLDRCSKFSNQSEVSHIWDSCPETCGLCGRSCQDGDGLYFQGETRGCDWIGEKAGTRCAKFSTAPTHCPESCGFCNATRVPVSSTCQDNEEWYYHEKYSFVTCAWVREDQTEDRCRHSRMKHYCPETCGTCCDDETGWHKCINCPGGGNPDKDCAYYGEVGCGSAAMEHCPRTCGLCPHYLANAGGPFPNITEV